MKDEFISRIGVWGQRHYNYLKKHGPTVINVMRMKGTLEQYLTDLDRDAQDTFERMIGQYAEIEGVNERLKAEDNLEWTRRMNSIRNRVEEFILSDFVYA
ncbi:MAG: TnpV protein [Clostridia bacterium]|nr:TnpV protein [Clostridia bacterium]